MSTITDVRRALRAAIPQDTLGLTNCAVAPAPAEYGDHPMDVDRVGFHVTATVGPAGEDAEDRLDALLDPAGGVRVLLEGGDRTLGGLVASLNVTKCSGYQALQRFPTEPPELGATWTVVCLM